MTLRRKLVALCSLVAAALTPAAAMAATPAEALLLEMDRICVPSKAEPEIARALAIIDGWTDDGKTKAGHLRLAKTVGSRRLTLVLATTARGEGRIRVRSCLILDLKTPAPEFSALLRERFGTAPTLPGEAGDDIWVYQDRPEGQKVFAPTEANEGMAPSETLGVLSAGGLMYAEAVVVRPD